MRKDVKCIFNIPLNENNNHTKQCVCVCVCNKKKAICTYLNELKKEIPDRISCAMPVNIRSNKYSNDKNKETIIGNKVGAFLIYLPIKASYTFEQRVKIIEKQVNYCKKINESKWLYIMQVIISRLPAYCGTQIHTMSSHQTTTVITNVRGPTESLNMLGLLHV